MNKILITGATGNIGVEVIRFLCNFDTTNKIIVGARNIEKAKKIFIDYPRLSYVYFDIELIETFDNAFADIDRVFLMRPPHISDVERFFKPLILSFVKANIKEVVFLSVQGAEKSRLIPHHKIERLIRESGLNHIFIRPSYFMQNLTTTLNKDIREKRQIIIPAGNALFNWVDTKNIGEVGAVLLKNFNVYKNQAYEITGLENEQFSKVTELINNEIEYPIRFRNINPILYFIIKKYEGMKSGMIIVLILLHFLQRFQKAPNISHFYEQLTHKKPTDLRSFIKREKNHFDKSS